jgi:hypothetical protein
MTVEKIYPGFYPIKFKDVKIRFRRVYFNGEKYRLGEWKYLGEYDDAHVFRRKGVERIIMDYFGGTQVVDNFGFVCPPVSVLYKQKKMYTKDDAKKFVPLVIAKYEANELYKGEEYALMYDGKWMCLSPVSRLCDKVVCYYAPGLGGIVKYREDGYDFTHGRMYFLRNENGILIKWDSKINL